jgi:hypothetical protein
MSSALVTEALNTGFVPVVIPTTYVAKTSMVIVVLLIFRLSINFILASKDLQLLLPATEALMFKAVAKS